VATQYRRALVRCLAIGTAALLAAGILPAATGQAAPGPSLASVQRQIVALQLEADTAVEDYDAAALALASARRRSAAAVDRLARQRVATEALRARLSSFAAAAYRSGGVGQFASLVLTSDPTTFLDRAAALDQIAQSQADAVRQFQLAVAALAEVEVAARQQAAAAAAVERRMADRRAAIEHSLWAEQALLARLKPLERRRLQEAQQAQDRLVSSRAPSPPTTAPAAHGSGRGAVAVRFAYSQLGKPYQWGASGPGSYDCSGLTMAAWAAAGVPLPHSSGGQFGSGTHIPFAALIPGDLVFYGHPIHHVGIYVGSGLMISSPHTGTVVKIQSASRGDFAGAVRP